MAHLSIIVKPDRNFDVAVTDTEGIYLNDQFTRECVETTLKGLQERRSLNIVGDPRDAIMAPLDFGPGEFRFTPIDVGLTSASWSVDLVLPQRDGIEKPLHVGRFETILEAFESALDQEYREPASVEVLTENRKQ
ncbi:hypothetical protein [Deinococcus cellulosilyticus]|uniref:Uncharacterized protein n=1 Tax=Deinococcus cellulosilyticus (strain DSM 18568 / NBRC 106333 / KACC 11606 / 5516J-15) TaxID=1223518 RepID=A0A511MVJ9_DEIC1|nr:hypothetical protein [Deinococcus cellulosilyticus]GEM44602.1 hypothetical protein DC3_02370 [Deinococcus cellulosilyticus NBRC 106333 = KACC 11606]